MKKLDDANYEIEQELPSEDAKLRMRRKKKIRSDKKTNFHPLDPGQNDSDSESDENENDYEGISITDEDEMKIRSLVKSDETVIEESLLFDH